MFNVPGKISAIRTKQAIKTNNDNYYGANSQNTSQIAQNTRRPGITIIRK
jgi:hypothetical protein